MARARVASSLLLCLVGGALALILLGKHYGVALLGEAALAACGVGEGCDIVAQSAYSVFMGLPLAAWGLFFYGALLALLAPSMFESDSAGTTPARAAAFCLVAFSVVLDVVLFGLQLVVIKAFCKFCVATYFVNLLLLAALWPYRQFSQALNFLFTPGARPALASWVVACLAIGVAAVAGNTALTEKKALAAGSILGIPFAPAPSNTSGTSVPAAKGSLEEQLAEARLDDGRLTGGDGGHLLRRYVDADHAKAEIGQAGHRDGAHIAETDDADGRLVARRLLQGDDIGEPGLPAERRVRHIHLLTLPLFPDVRRGVRHGGRRLLGV